MLTTERLVQLTGLLLALAGSLALCWLAYDTVAQARGMLGDRPLHVLMEQGNGGRCLRMIRGLPLQPYARNPCRRKT